MFDKMSAKPYPNFRSIDSKIKDSVALHNKIGKFLDQSLCFENRCPPWEADEWDIEELKDFKVSTYMIDRIYDYQCRFFLGAENDCVFLYARMPYKGRSLYFHMCFLIGGNFWSNVKGVKTYLTFNAQVFLKSVIGGTCDTREIRKLMVEDGLEVDEPTTFDLYDQWDWWKRGAPTLNFLCQLAVYENRNQLKHRTEFLPCTVAKDLEQFVKVRETIEHLRRDVYDDDEFN